MSEWIKEKSDIEKRTGLKPGSVKIKDETFENNICLYDCKSANFHLLPRLDLEGAESALNDYLKVVEEVQKEINNIIKCRLSDLARIKGKGNLNEYPPEYKERGIRNAFYKYISIYDGQRYYTINFMRWYIDKENKVNCRFGEIQFDTTINKKRRVNTAQFKEKDRGKDIIRYPKSYKGQSEKMIRLDGEDQVCVYNPKGIGNIWKIQEEAKKEEQKAYNDVVENFIEFIKKVRGEGN